jgi:hypothetical protein
LGGDAGQQLVEHRVPAALGQQPVAVQRQQLVERTPRHVGGGDHVADRPGERHDQPLGQGRRRGRRRLHLGHGLAPAGAVRPQEAVDGPGVLGLLGPPGGEEPADQRVGQRRGVTGQATEVAGGEALDVAHVDEAVEGVVVELDERCVLPADAAGVEERRSGHEPLAAPLVAPPDVIWNLPCVHAPVSSRPPTVDDRRGRRGHPRWAKGPKKAAHSADSRHQWWQCGHR